MTPLTPPITTSPILFWRDLLNVALPCEAGIVMVISYKVGFILRVVTLSLVLCYLQQRSLGGVQGEREVVYSQGCCWLNSKNFDYSYEKPSMQFAISSGVIIKVLCICENMHRSKHPDFQDKWWFIKKMHTKCLIYKLFITQQGSRTCTVLQTLHAKQVF